MNTTKISTAVLFLMTVSIQAQITITQDDFPTIGVTWTNLTDSSSVISPGNAGDNQVWDFSMFTSGETESHFLDYGLNNFHPAFPEANSTPCNNFGSFEVCAYYDINPNGVFLLGSSINIEMPEPNYFYGTVSYTPEVAELPLPFTYNSEYELEFIGTQVNVSNPPQNGYDSTRYVTHSTLNYEADGWGTVHTPFGTYDALRMKITETSQDSAWGHVPGSGWELQYVDPVFNYTSYKWLANTTWAVVATLRGGTTGVVDFWDYTFSQTDETVSIQEILPKPPVLYPNPVQNELSISGDAVFERLQILDMTGKMVLQSGPAKSIDVHNLKPGIYVVRFEADGALHNHKIIKL